jgi:hypothetical protein
VFSTYINWTKTTRIRHSKKIIVDGEFLGYQGGEYEQQIQTTQVLAGEAGG